MKKISMLLGVLLLALSGCKSAGPVAATSPEASGAVIQAACTKPCYIMACPPPNGTVKKCCPVYPYNQTCP